jgi:hypothetical protein
MISIRYKPIYCEFCYNPSKANLALCSGSALFLCVSLRSVLFTFIWNRIALEMFYRVRNNLETCLFSAYPKLYYLLTFSMQHSPSWEANRFAASQEIPRILWNSKVHYRIHKCRPPIPIMSQLHVSLVHNLTSHFLKIYHIILFPSSLCLPSGFFPSGFPT